MVPGASSVFADSMKIKDIIDKNSALRGQELTVAGEIVDIGE